MLIKSSIVEKWYHRDSFVYRSFTYLFVNPLWEKRIPQGFSVCPYFWLSMFSFFIFRPLFVAPIKYVILPIMNLIGKPATTVDKFFYNFLCKLLGGPGSKYFKGIGCLGAIVLLLLAAALLALIVLIGDVIRRGYINLSTTSIGLFTFWSCLTFGVLITSVSIHKLFVNSNCKPIYYMFVWLALFIVSAFIFIPSETIGALGVLFIGIGHLITSILSCAWLAISVCAKFVWGWTAIGLAWKPVAVLVLPWWGYFVILTIIGWIADKLFTYHSNNYTNYTLKTNPKEMYSIYRKAWIDMFVNILLSNK
jgi:hypothetical protein